MLRCIDLQIVINISEHCSALIFRVKLSKKSLLGLPSPEYKCKTLAKIYQSAKCKMPQTWNFKKTLLQAPQICDGILFITKETAFNIYIYIINAFIDENANLGSRYLRQCESMLIAQKRIEILMAAHNSSNPDFPYTNCEPDGSYGAKQRDGNLYVH